MFSTFHCLFTPKANQTDKHNMSVSEREVPMDLQRDRVRNNDMAVWQMERDMAGAWEVWFLKKIVYTLNKSFFFINAIDTNK